VGHAIADGINFPLMIYNHVNKITSDFPANYRVGTKWYNIITDSVFAGMSMLKNQYSFKEYLRTLKGKKHHAVFQKSDPKPGIMFIALLPYFFLNR
jgi:predicted ATP-grasp superfamily ATP-dependent carboligase